MTAASARLLCSCLAVGLVAASAGAAAVSAAAPPRLYGDRPYWVAQGRVVAFDGWARRDEADRRIWRMNIDGSRKIPVSPRGVNGEASIGEGGDATLSPTGRLLATATLTNFTRVRVTISVLATKRTIATLTWRSKEINSVARPVWAPDERAVWVGDDDGRNFVVDLRTGRARRLPSVYFRDSPAWSPDGRHLAFVGGCGGLRLCYFVASRDGSHPHVLLRTGGGPPEWAPDGRMLAFGQGYLRGTCPSGGKKCRTLDRHWEYRDAIFVARADGSRLRRLVDIKRPPRSVWKAASLAWSSEGRQLAFTWPSGVFVANVGRGGARRVTFKGAASSTLEWAPSSKILFSHQGTIYTVRPGERPTRVPT